MVPRKLRLSREHLIELGTDDLQAIRGGAEESVRATECGWNCCTTTPVNQCLISLDCALAGVTGRACA